MTTLIHVTHEAHEKMGGIGAVLEGLLTTRAYQNAVDRTILLGAGAVPLGKPSDEIEVILYQTGVAAQPADGYPGGSAEALVVPVEAFRRIEAAYGVRILYAHRAVSCPLETRRTVVELLLLDVRDARVEPLNQLKKQLYEAYGIASDQYEHDWGYEEWVRVAGPALEAVAALAGPALGETILVSHEFMGLPTLLAARLRMPDLRTVYWAHEVPSVRDFLEKRTEHRLVFDQALARREGLGPYEALLRESGGFKHALVSRAHHAHRVFTVSDRIARELELLSSQFRRTPMEVVYNGLPVRPIELADRLRSRTLLRRYAEAVVGFRPDFVFTHVARPVASKAIDRDLAVLEHLDDLLAEQGRTAVLLILATDGGRRDRDCILQMEDEYGWPLNHRVGWPDLTKGEIPLGQAAEPYNTWARATRVVLVNQFGFSREACGDRVPAEMTLQDLRQGSDAEFGQSAYEPFGIAPLETLAFGGLSVISRVCGCAQLLARVAGDDLPPNVLLAHYGAPARNGGPVTVDDTKRIEHEVAAQLAKELAARLPTSSEAYRLLLESGWSLAEKMSWQAVCRQYFVPALERCLGRRTRRHPAPSADGSSALTGPAVASTATPQ
jgi:glycosyltransferase involved in cell wall biosynthesis